MPTNSATLQTRNVWAVYLIMREYSVAQLCLILCDALDCSLPGSSVNEIFQARILEWIVIFKCRGSSRFRDWTHISCISCIGRQVLHCWATWEAQTPLPRLCSVEEEAFFFKLDFFLLLLSLYNHILFHYDLS